MKAVVRGDRANPYWCPECRVFHYPQFLMGMAVIACPSMSEGETIIRQPPKIDRDRPGGQKN